MMMMALKQQYNHHLLRVHNVSSIYIDLQMPWICYTVFLEIELQENIRTNEVQGFMELTSLNQENY